MPNSFTTVSGVSFTCLSLFIRKRVIETVPPDFSPRLTYLNKCKKFKKTEKTTSKFIIDIFIYTYKSLCKIFVFFPYPLQVAKFISLQ